MKLIMACLFMGLFISCAHSTKNETSANQDKVEKNSDTKTYFTLIKISLGCFFM